MNSEEDLKPRPPPRLVQHGIRTFTMYREVDESGVSGTGLVLEGVIWASGGCVTHWLTIKPSGSLGIWGSFDDFLNVHVRSHMVNQTIITFENGEQLHFPEEE